MALLFANQVFTDFSVMQHTVASSDTCSGLGFGTSLKNLCQQMVSFTIWKISSFLHSNLCINESEHSVPL